MRFLPLLLIAAALAASTSLAAAKPPVDGTDPVKLEAAEAG